MINQNYNLSYKLLQVKSNQKKTVIIIERFLRNKKVQKKKKQTIFSPTKSLNPNYK